MKYIIWQIFLLLTAVGTVSAGEVDVVKVDVQPDDSGAYRFDVTLKHADAGRDHYADRWEILTVEGEVLATRVLVHPHVNEQPFSRSLSGVVLPEGVSEVVIRGHDSVHGYGGKERIVKLSH